VDSPGRPYRATATGAVGAVGKGIGILAIIVGKAVAGGTIAVWNGADATGASTLVGTWAMDTAQSFQTGGMFLDKGCWLVITGASPDVTVIAR
jgi:hypothetical protein